MLRAVAEDLRFAFRQIRKDLGVSIVLVVTIALGIGVNTAIYGMLNGFLRPLPIPNSNQIVVLAAQVKGDETGVEFDMSFPALQDLRAQATEFSDIFAYVAQIAGFNAGDKSTQFLYAGV